MEDWERDSHTNADVDALIAYCSYYENIGMAEYLPNLTVPCLLYAGEKDTYPHSRAKACAEIMQNAEFLSLPGLDHPGKFLTKATLCFRISYGSLRKQLKFECMSECDHR